MHEKTDETLEAHKVNDDNNQVAAIYLWVSWKVATAKSYSFSSDFSKSQKFYNYGKKKLNFTEATHRLFVFMEWKSEKKGVECV